MSFVRTVLPDDLHGQELLLEIEDRRESDTLEIFIEDLS